MRYAALLFPCLMMGCRCSNGPGSDGDAREDVTNVDSADAREDEGRLDGVEDPGRDPDAEVRETIDMKDAGEDPPIDQLPSDCFSPLDGPDDLIPADWVAVLPDREPTPCDGCCRQVTISPYDNISPYDVEGRYVVYLIVREEGGTLTQLRIKRIDRPEEYIIREKIFDPLYSVLGPPAMYGNQFVYSFGYVFSETSRRCELIVVTLPSGVSEIIHAFNVPRDGGWCPGSVEANIDFNGTQVVYGANKVGGAGMEQIFLYDLTTGEDVQISQGPCCSLITRVWESKVVYFGFFSYSAEIYLYDILTGVTTNITNDDFDGRRDQQTPSIWEDRIVYVDGPYSDTEQNADILMKTIAGVEPIPVCTNPAAQLWPDIFGDLVAWSDYRNDPCPNLECRGTNTDIYYYRISTGMEHRLTSSPGIEGTARVMGNRIFFKMRDSAGIYSIFMKEAEP